MAQYGYELNKPARRYAGEEVLLNLVQESEARLLEGFPVAYEVLAGNRQDRTTLEDLLKAVEAKYGAARRTWIFDRGVVSEANLQRLREHVPPLPYVVGTPKSAMKAFETSLVEGAWQHVREDVEVKCVPAPGGAETFVLCRSRGRQRKEEAMRKTACAKLENGLTKLANAVKTGRVKDEEGNGFLAPLIKRR